MVEQLPHLRRQRGVRGLLGIENERTIVRVAVAVHVAGDAWRDRYARSSRHGPVEPQRVEKIVIEADLDLVLRVDVVGTPLSIEWVADRAAEAVDQMAIPRSRVARVPREGRAELGGRQSERELLRVRSQVGVDEAHA